MTRAEAKAEVQKLWNFKEIGGLIAVRDVELIRVAARTEADPSAFRAPATRVPDRNRPANVPAAS